MISVITQVKFCTQTLLLTCKFKQIFKWKIFSFLQNGMHLHSGLFFILISLIRIGEETGGKKKRSSVGKSFPLELINLATRGNSFVLETIIWPEDLVSSLLLCIQLINTTKSKTNSSYFYLLPNDMGLIRSSLQLGLAVISSTSSDVMKKSGQPTYWAILTVWNLLVLIDRYVIYICCNVMLLICSAMWICMI